MSEKNTAAATAEAHTLKAALVKYLRGRAAKSPTKAVPFSAVAESLGVSPRLAYTLVCGSSGKAGSNPGCLMATGHAKTTKVREVKGLCVYLTPAGLKTKFDEKPFVAKAAKAEDNGKGE